jgi:hypothetical protein
MCIIDDEDDIEENDNKKEEFNLEAMTPHISLNALEGTTGFYTLKVTWRVDKHFYSLWWILRVHTISLIHKWKTNYSATSSLSSL